MKQNFVNEEDIKKKSRGKYFIWIFFFLVLLFFSVFGITYSFYNYVGDDNGDDNAIETGGIVFTYSDVDKIGSGIIINNAYPITDDVGKNMVGSNQYFDFSITAELKSSSINYKILALKEQSSTLDDRNVSIYLTKINGNYEDKLVLNYFHNLDDFTLEDKRYKIVYEEVLDSSVKKYQNSFRLRMWVHENAIDYNDKNFSVKIDVYATQEEE